MDRIERLSDPIKMLSNVRVKRFDGKHESYSRFRAMFIDMVHTKNVPLSTKTWALYIMLDETVPANMEILDTLFEVNEGYKGAILAMEREYGAKKRTIKEQIDRVKKHPRVRFSDYESLRSFVKKVKDCISILDKHGKPNEKEGESFYYDVYDKLPDQAEKKYADFLEDNDLEDEMDNLIAWLEKELRSLKRIVDKKAAKEKEKESEKKELTFKKPKTFMCHHEENEESDSEEEEAF